MREGSRNFRDCARRIHLAADGQSLQDLQSLGNRVKTLVGALALGLLAGCGGGVREVPQDTLCVYATDEAAKQCKDGRLAWFKPNSWGNEQLPLLAAASYCDFNHPVTMNGAGVICVFTSKRLSSDEKK
jgi:hypothetical protein